MSRRNEGKHSGGEYDRAYRFVAGLRGHSRRDLGAEYLDDRIKAGANAEQLSAASDAINDAIEDGES